MLHLNPVIPNCIDYPAYKAVALWVISSSEWKSRLDGRRESKQHPRLQYVQVYFECACKVHNDIESFRHTQCILECVSDIIMLCIRT